MPGSSSVLSLLCLHLFLHPVVGPNRPFYPASSFFQGKLRQIRFHALLDMSNQPERPWTEDEKVSSLYTDKELALFGFYIDYTYGWLTDENDLLRFPVHSAYRDVEEGRNTVQLSGQDDL